MASLGSLMRQMWPALHSRCCTSLWTAASWCLTNETVAGKCSCLSQATANQGDERSLVLTSSWISSKENSRRTSHFVRAQGEGCLSSIQLSRNWHRFIQQQLRAFERPWATTSILTQYFIIPPSPSLEQEFSLSYALLCQIVWNHLHASLTQMLNSAWGGLQHCLDLEETERTFWVSFFTPMSYTLQWSLSSSHPISDRNSTDSFFQAGLGHLLISPKIAMQVTNNPYVLTRAINMLALLGTQNFKIYCAFSKWILCINVYYMCCL